MEDDDVSSASGRLGHRSDSLFPVNAALNRGLTPASGAIVKFGHPRPGLHILAALDSAGTRCDPSGHAQAMRQDEQPGDASWFTAELKEPGYHSGKADDSRFVEHFIHGECTMEECAGASPEWCYITHAREVNPFSRQIPTALDARPRFHQPGITSPCSTSSYGPRMATHGMPLVPSPAATTGRSPPELRDYIEGGDFGPGQVLADTNSRRYTIGSLRIDRFDLSGHNSGIRRYATDSSDDAPATGTASTYFFCVNTTIFFSQPRQRPDSILHSNQVDAPARQGVCNTGDPHDCYAIGSHAVDYDVDHSAERVFLDFLSLPRLRLARRHTPLRYRFAHAVDHNVDDSADGLRPDSHQRSEEIDEASYGCSTRAVRRLVEGGDVGPKPRQTPFTLSLLESRGVVLESGGPVRPVS